MFEVTRLKHAIKVEHGCTAEHARSRLIVEKQPDGTIWRGTVHVFNLADHPATDCCYAWMETQNGATVCTTVLKMPPVKSAQTAVRAGLRAKGAQSEQPVTADSLPTRRPRRLLAGS